MNIFKNSLVLLAVLSINLGFSQITGNGSSSTVPTLYTDGSANDEIFVYCVQPGSPANIGSLTANPPSGPGPWDFEWYQYNSGTNSFDPYFTDNNQLASTIDNLPSGGYSVSVMDDNGVVVGCYNTWVFCNETDVDAGNIATNCGGFNLNGAADPIADFVYYNPPPDQFIIDANTEITVCFDATHTWVSDLGFFLIAPDGTPVTLSPNPGAIGQGTVCNAGDNVNGLCFTTNAAANFDACLQAAPYSGTFDSYGPAPGTPIDWSVVYGQDAAQNGWSIQIFDCIGGDVGALTNASVTFTGNSVCGPEIITYDSGTINSVIGDNTCTQATASVFQIPADPVLTTPIVLANTITNIQWTNDNPCVTIPNATTSLNPGIASTPTADTWFYLTATDNFGCTYTDSVLFVRDCPCATNSPFNYLGANLSAPDCVAGTFDVVGGEVQFDDGLVPCTGTLTISNCSGDNVVFNAPFTSPILFTIPGIVADGTPNCSIIAEFSDDPENCTIETSMYTEPDCPCNIDSYNVNIGGCQPVDNTYDVTGTIEFTNPPTTGTLVVTVDNGTTTYDTIINAADFISPLDFSISGIDSDEAASTITATFSADGGCTASINYTAPADCYCSAEIGTFNSTMTGDGNTDFILCFGDEFNYQSNGDYTPPDDIGGFYDPGIAYLMYSCPPTPGMTPDGDPVTGDPCVLGVVLDGSGSLLYNDANDLGWVNAFPPGTFTDNTIYYVPVTMYDITNGFYSVAIEPCYELGPAIAVQYLPEIKVTDVEDCQAGTITTTILGGLPEVNGSNFNVVPASLSPANASFDNTSAPNLGTITISGLTNGQAYQYSVVDDNGCPIVVSGVFIGTENPGFSYDNNVICTNEADPVVNITGDAGTFTAVLTSGIGPNLSINGNTGAIDASASDPGTYDVTYTTNDITCFSDSTVSITINYTPIIEPITDQTVCAGFDFSAIPFVETNATVGTTFDWTNNNTSIGLGANGTGDNIGVFTGVNATAAQASGTVTVTPTLNGCVGLPIDFDLIVNPIPVVDAGTDQIICEPLQATLTATNPNGATIVWDNGVTDGVAFTAPLNTTTTYTVTATLAGCISTDQVDVTVNPLPIVNAGIDITVCDGIDTLLTATNPDGAALVWDNGITDGTIFSPTVGTTTYTVTATLLGCISTDDVDVSVNPLPTFTLAGTDPTVCGGTDGFVTISGLTPSTAYDITYNDGAIQGPTSMNSNGAGEIILTGLGAGNYTDFVVSILGCETIDNTVINLVDPSAPIVNAGTDQTVCDPVQVTLTATNPDGATITWDNGVTDGVAFNAPVDATTTYTVTATLAGCISTDQVDVTVNPLPIVNAGVDITVCDGIDTLLTATNPDGAALVWDNGITDGTIFSPTVGTTTYTVTATLLGCISTDDVDVTVNPLPIFAVAGTDPTVCGGTDGFVTISGLTPSTAYDITYNDGAIQGPTSMNSNGAGEIILTGLGAGNYTEFVVSILGCETIDNTVINLVDPSAPTVNAGTDQTVCDPVQVTLTATNPDGATITWDNGVTDGVAFSAPVDATTTYTVTATLAGCISTDQVDVTVNPLPIVNAGVDITVCDGIDTLLTATNPDGAALVWDNGITDGTIFSPTVGTTTYTVTATLLGCISTDDVDVTVNPLPIFAVAGTDPTVCGGTDGFVTISGLTPSTAYDITYDDGAVQGSTSMNSNGAGEIILTGLSAGNYTGFVVSILGCETIDNTVINLVDPSAPIVNAGTDQTVCDPVQVTLTATNPDGATITWDNGVTDGVAFNAPVDATTTYTVTANLAGCISTDDVDVTVNPLPVIDAGVDVTLCDGINTTLTATNPDGAALVWDNGITDGVEFSPSIGTITYTVTGTLLGCVTVDDMDVIINPLDNPGFSYPVYSYCSSELDPTATIDVAGGAFSFSAIAGGPILSIDLATGLIDLDASSPGTYEVTYTTSGLCPQDSTITMNIAATPSVNAIADQIVCPIPGDEFNTVFISGSVGSTFNWVNDNTLIGLAANGAGDIAGFLGVNTTAAAISATITVTPVAGSCTGVSTDFTFTVNPLDNPGFSYPAYEFCTADLVDPSATIDVAGGGFTSTTIIGTGSLSLDAVTGQIDLDASDAGTYEITYTTTDLCPQDSTITMVINLTPVVNTTVNDTVCENTTFNAVNFTGTPGATFNWVNDNTLTGLGANGVGNISPVTGVTSGGQEVSMITVTPILGTCIGSDSTFEFVVNPLDNPGFSYPLYGYCTDDTNPFATIDVAGGVFTYTVITGGPTLVLDNTTGEIDLNASDEGLYDITYTTSGVCVQDSTITMSINFTPTVDAVLDQTVCHGTDDIVDVIFSGTDGVLATTYDWTNDNVTIGLGANGTGDIASFTANNTSAVQVSGLITVTPSTVSCSGTPITFEYIIDPLDIPTFEYVDGLTYCATGTNSPVSNITGNTGGTFSYTVNSGGPVLAINTTTGDIDLATSNTGSYDITYTTVGVCPQTSTLTLVITNAPVANFSFFEYCLTDTDPMPDYINDDQGVPFATSGSGGLFTEPTGLISINSITGEVDLGGSTPGTYTVTNTIDLTGCAIAIATEDVVIYQIPTVSFMGGTFCPDATLPDVEVNVVGTDPTWTIIYEYNGVVQPFIASQTLPLIIPNAPFGNYEIVSVADGHCTSIISESVDVSAYPEVVIQAMTDYVVCEGDELTIDQFGSVPTGNTHDWVLTPLASDVGFGSDGSGNIGTFTSVNPQTVTVEVIPTSSVANGSCIGDPISFEIVVNPTPIVDFTADNFTGCAPVSIEFTSLSTNGDIYEWTFGDGGTGNGAISTYTYQDAGVYDVGLTVTSTEGCFDAASATGYITVTPMPIADFSFTPEITDVSHTEIEFTNASVNGDYYEWNFGDDSGINNDTDPIHMYSDIPNQYPITLLVTNNNGVCRDSIQKFLTINDVLLYYVPNVFTPDQDAYNEVFKPIFTSGFDPFDYHLMIFNRWGETIFESYDANYGWDGTYPVDSDLCADGVYVWKISFKETMSDKRHDITGHVSLLK